MNPFAEPPSTSPVQLDPPSAPPAPRRGRMALIGVATVGLLAAGVVGVSALASADDDPVDGAAGELVPAEADEGAPSAPPVDDDEMDGGTLPELDPDADVESSFEGEISIESGDGDPIVIDLGELSKLDDEALVRFQECAGLPSWLDGAGDLDLRFGDGELDAQLDELFAELETWLDGWIEGGFDGPLLDGQRDGGPIPPDLLADRGSVTVVGPDGVTIIDLGDGDGSVTVTRDGDTGQLTITTDGTAIEQELGDLVGDLLGDLPRLDGEFRLPEFDGDFHLPGGLDTERITDCLAELG